MRNSSNFLSVGALVLLSACATGGSTDFSDTDAAAIRAAEAFAVRHGFTDAPHPRDQPVLDVELFDNLAENSDELLKGRYNRIQLPAFGFGKTSRGLYYVLFRATKDPTEIWGIAVVDGEATQVLHTLPMGYKKSWRPVPPDPELQRAIRP